jgi:hypothetical protein
MRRRRSQWRSSGRYRVWVRTKNWVGPWERPWIAPGKFQVSVNGGKLGKELGTEGKDWLWEDGGESRAERRQGGARPA